MRKAPLLQHKRLDFLAKSHYGNAKLFSDKEMIQNSADFHRYVMVATHASSLRQALIKLSIPNISTDGHCWLMHCPCDNSEKEIALVKEDHDIKAVIKVAKPNRDGATNCFKNGFPDDDFSYHGCCFNMREWRFRFDLLKMVGVNVPEIYHQDDYLWAEQFIDETAGEARQLCNSEDKKIQWFEQIGEIYGGLDAAGFTPTQVLSDIRWHNQRAYLVDFGSDLSTQRVPQSPRNNEGFMLWELEQLVCRHLPTAMFRHAHMGYMRKYKDVEHAMHSEAVQQLVAEHRQRKF